MHLTRCVVTVAAVLVALPTYAIDERPDREADRDPPLRVQLGPRPYYLIEKMDDGRLKRALQRCSEGPFRKTDFSIGHRGAALQFPEHTKESYQAAARMGAGIVECDVTFTKDRQLVCRHDQCDLHTTTNILATPLAQKCSVPPDFASGTPFARVQCCTSDITLAEFKTLCGKMDAGDPNAATLDQYLNSTLDWRTDLYSTCGTLMTHAESIELFKRLDVKMTPELKAPRVTMPFQGTFTQQDFAQQMIDEYKAARVNPRDVFPQSFNLADVLYWIQREPAFGKQAVFLDDANTPSELPDFNELKSYARRGVNIVAPPMWALLDVNARKQIVPSRYTRDAKAAGLDIITWTLERSGRLIEDMKEGTGGPFYYQTTLDAIRNDGDILVTLDVLARQVGILGIFSDWPATVTYYASCMGLK